MSAIVNGTTVRQLERPTSGDESVTEEDAADRAKLARLLGRMLRDIATLKRRWWPRRIDFEDRAITSATLEYRFDHGLGGRVRWWIVQWRATSQASNYVPLLMESSSTDENTLILTSVAVGAIGAFTGTLTLRVEEVG